MVAEIRARLFAFAFVTTLRRVLGLPLSRWFSLGLWLVVLVTPWTRLWPLAIAALAALFLLRQLYRRARRRGYATFTPLKNWPDVSDVALLPGEVRIPVRATGIFSAGRHEHDVLLRPGSCWHIPLNEHAIMVESGPGRYLYQFIQPGFLEKVEIGHFLFGSDHFPGLKITFHTDWSPQLDFSGIAYYIGGGREQIGRLKRTIYLTFDNEADWLAVWKSLVGREPTS